MTAAGTDVPLAMIKGGFLLVIQKGENAKERDVAIPFRHLKSQFTARTSVHVPTLDNIQQKPYLPAASLRKF